MFNDKYGLTEAVIAGRKTMTRREISCKVCQSVLTPLRYAGSDLSSFNPAMRHAQYSIGEIVAIAQPYYKVFDTEMKFRAAERKVGEILEKGFRNKMFVRADLMPHQIRITDVKIERLQDISNADALREGVYHYTTPPLTHELDPYAPWPPYVKPYMYDADNLKYFCEARWAFKHLINKVSGGSTWNRNPWVFVYSFELVK